MRTRLKLLLTAVVVEASICLLSLFFGWMNRPSDFWFWMGSIGALKVVLFAPAIIAVIWRPEIVRGWADRIGQGRTK